MGIVKVDDKLVTDPSKEIEVQEGTQIQIGKSLKSIMKKDD